MEQLFETLPAKDSQNASVKRLVGVYNNPSQLPSKPDGAVRFVAVSDTHEREHNMHHKVPEGDVLLHAGDFTFTGAAEAVHKFNKWLGAQPHKHKIVIAGNHDITFDLKYYQEKGRQRFHRGRVHAADEIKKSLTNCIYLEDSECTVEGIRIYGSPWQPEFCDWAFNLDRGSKEIKAKWELIPEGTEVLVTHGPAAKGHGGICQDGFDAGCEDLLRRIFTVKPLVHVCGHIHEGYGITAAKDVTFINASTCDFSYRPSNPPVVFDIKTQ